MSGPPAAVHATRGRASGHLAGAPPRQDGASAPPREVLEVVGGHHLRYGTVGILL
jgi:hypothetical protein